MGTRYTICCWAINRSDPQNLLSITLDVPLQDAPPPAGESATTAITNHIVRLAREGRAEHIHFLLVLRATETHVLPKTFKDVAKLLADSKKRWLESCLEELKSLKDKDIYEIVDFPKRRKMVKNR